MTSNLAGIGRYNQIISVFAKHGFGLLMDQLGIFKYLKIRKKISSKNTETNNSKLSTGERLRRSFEELGPTFVKLGQIMSTRQDILPSDIVEGLKKLQDSVQPFPFTEVKTLIEAEFEDKLENIFKEFDENPTAAASISQVHSAILRSGKKVAVKVQRQGIERTISTDLNILKDLAHFVDNHTKLGRFYDFSGMVQEFENTLKNELDFTKEAENADRFRENFAVDKGIMVPGIRWVYTTKHIVTMDYVEGIRIDDNTALDKAGIDRKELAGRLTTSICNQILRDGFFHADPHPGNIRVLSDGTIMFLDLGMVGRLSEQRRKSMSKFFIGVMNKDSKMVVRSLIDLDTVGEKKDLKKFQQDVDIMIEKYLTMPWNELKIGDLFREIFSIAYKNNIKIPREFTLISKTLATVQGILEMLSPNLNALILAKPIAKKLVYQSFSLKNITGDLKKSIFEYKDILRGLPSTMLSLFEKMEDGGFTVQFEIKNIENIQKRFDRVFNRISFSVMLLAVSIIIAGIIIGSGLSAGKGSEMYLLNITVLKIGLAIAGVIIIGLIVSILRSNRQ